MTWNDGWKGLSSSVWKKCSVHKWFPSLRPQWMLGYSGLTAANHHESLFHQCFRSFHVARGPQSFAKNGDFQFHLQTVWVSRFGSGPRHFCILTSIAVILDILGCNFEKLLRTVKRWEHALSACFLCLPRELVAQVGLLWFISLNKMQHSSPGALNSSGHMTWHESREAGLAVSPGS